VPQREAMLALSIVTAIQSLAPLPESIDHFIRGYNIDNDSLEMHLRLIKIKKFSTECSIFRMTYTFVQSKEMSLDLELCEHAEVAYEK
jgi:hypothetical protein